MNNSTQWTPVLHGSLRDKARAVVDAILADLSDLSPDRSASVSDPFMAVLFADAARQLDRPELRRVAIQRLNFAIECVENARVRRLGLHGGLCGVGWLLSRLTADVPGDTDDACASVDSVVSGALRDWDVTERDYDLISGLVGLGVYGLERLPRESARAIVSTVLTHLERAARVTAQGLAWWTPRTLVPAEQRSLVEDGYYDVGVAHGTPGVVAFLGHVYRAGIEADRVEKLAEGAVDWLLRQRVERGDGAGYPSWIEPGKPPVPTRMAWCYGGLGVSAALMTAGRAMRRLDWQDEAIHLASLEAARTRERTYVFDACLCHGAAGNAFILQRFFAATGDTVFRDASERWYEWTLEMCRPGRGVGGYLFLDHGSMGANDAVLTGSAGVALALLAASNHVAPTWDRLLLTDMPPNGR